MTRITCLQMYRVAWPFREIRDGYLSRVRQTVCKDEMMSQSEEHRTKDAMMLFC